MSVARIGVFEIAPSRFQAAPAHLLELGVEVAFTVACDDAFEEFGGGDAGGTAGWEEFTFKFDLSS